MIRIIIPDVEEEKISSSMDIFVDSMVPLCYTYYGKSETIQDIMSILFLVKSDQEEEVYLSHIIQCESQEEIDYFKNSPLWLENIKQNEDQKKMYIEFTKNMNNLNLYTTGLYLVPDDKDKYFTCNGYQSTKDGEYTDRVRVYFYKKKFIQLYTFLSWLNLLDPNASLIFGDLRFNTTKFINVNTVKLTGTLDDPDSKVIVAHYEAGVHPSIYKFNYIAPKIRKVGLLRGAMSRSLYMTLFGKDPTCDIFLYEPHDDKFYAVLEIYSEVTGRFKEFVALVFTKEFYDKTNLRDFDNIYVKENKNNEEDEKG